MKFASEREKLEHMKDVARRYIEMISVGDPTGLEDVFHPEFVKHVSGPSDIVDYSGKEQALRGNLEPVRQHIINGRKAFSGGGEEIPVIIAEGDYVGLLYREWGVDTGMIPGASPTGKPVDYIGVEMYRFEDGKIIELWTSNMTLQSLRQLGWVVQIADGVPGFRRNPRE